MPGDRWQRFANLRAYFGFMWGHPGKKLLFMGGEFAQEREWNHDRELDWASIDDPHHAGIQRLVADLNRLYGQEPRCTGAIAKAAAFPGRSVTIARILYSHFCVLRRAAADSRRQQHDAGAAARLSDRRAARRRMARNPQHGFRLLRGSNIGNAGSVHASDIAMHGQPCSLELRCRRWPRSSSATRDKHGRRR